MNFPAVERRVGQQWGKTQVGDGKAGKEVRTVRLDRMLDERRFGGMLTLGARLGSNKYFQAQSMLGDGRLFEINTHAPYSMD